MVADCEGTCDFGGTASVDDPAVTNEVPDHAQSVVHASLGFFHNLQRNTSISASESDGIVATGHPEMASLFLQ